MLPCPFSHGEAPFGTVAPETPFDAIWLGPKFTELRGGSSPTIRRDMCRRCSFLASRYPDVAELFVARTV